MVIHARKVHAQSSARSGRFQSPARECGTESKEQGRKEELLLH